MAIKITEMTAEHLDAIVNIERECFSVPWSRAMFAEELGRDFAIYLVAEENGEILAYVGAHIAAEDVCINNVATAPRARSRGIAQELLRELACRAYARGGRQFSLEVRESNLPARALYAKLGFTEVGMRKKYYSHPTENAIIMVKGTV